MGGRAIRPIVPVIVKAGGKETAVYAMIDSAATSSAALLETIDSVNAEIFELPCKLSTFDSCMESRREFANFQIQPLDKSFTLEIRNALVGNILTTERDKPPRNQDIAHLDYMKDVHFKELDDPTIGVILDASHAWTWTRGEDRYRSESEPIAIQTKFGWTLIGPALNNAEDDALEAEICLLDSQEQSLQEHIAQMFRHDFIMRGDEIAPPEKIHPSDKDEFALKQMRDGIRFDENLGHYIVPPPWREGRAEAAKAFEEVDSFANAKSRLMKDKRKFTLDPARKEGTFKQIRETLSDGHARIVDPNRDITGLPKWYMPIHVVTRPDKPGKFRVCQDAASKVKDTYLNGHLCTGPDLLNSLVGVLLRFRRHKVAMSGDIRNFFHMIHVAEEDIAAFRFLFFKDERMQEIMEIESLVHIFGASSSPPVANFTLKHHAERMRAKYGDEVYFLILLAFYVDDFLSSFPSVEKAREMRQKLTAALAEGGFDLTKWASSHPEALLDEVDSTLSAERANSTPKIGIFATSVDLDTPSESSISQDLEAVFQEKTFSADEKPRNPLSYPQINSAPPPGKVLGLGYSYEDDKLFVRVGDKSKIKVTTKRELLKLVAGFYDPLGMAAPFILKGRQLFQIANQKYDWSEPLPEDMLKPINKWMSTIDDLNQVRIDRWVSTPEYVDAPVQLIICCDASPEGFGVVCYERREHPDGTKAHVSFVFAKALVVPSAMHKFKVPNQEDPTDSIPRLELTAARLAAEIRDKLVQESGQKYTEVIMFSDSNTVLNWITDHDRKFKTFENFRVKKIRLLTDTADWRHCPSKDNPADICSHGIYANEHDRWSFFLSGPSWLSGPMELWPPVRPEPKTKPSEIDVSAIDTVADFAPTQLIAINATVSLPVLGNEPVSSDWMLTLAKRRSGWRGKVSAIARAKRIFTAFVKFLREKRTSKQTRDINYNRNLTLPEYKTAEMQLINAIQRKHFSPEIKTLLKLGVTSPNALKELRNKSSLTNLNPFLDENLTLRVGGRLGKSDILSYDEKYPKILPQSDEHVSSLIRCEHEKLLHATISHCFHHLRSQYHILGGRRTVNNVIRFCVPCQKKEKRPSPQKLGDLPIERVNFIKPFRCTAIDVFGPYGVKNGGRATHKRWVLLSTCLATRAISLLPLKDMSTPTLINALIKLHNMFPGIELIYSDNGTNMRGASREIKEAVKAWNSEQINESLLAEGIEWKWSPPNCPHFGGIWERLVRSSKRHLKFVLEIENLELDTFETALSQVAAILNNRPLTHASPEIDDMRVLTPANFLYPYTITPSSTTLLPPIPSGGDHMRGAWRDVRRIANLFNERWQKEYLATLQSRSKWQQSTPNFYVGQLVLIVDDQEPRRDWKIARVDKIVSEDSHVRRVVVTTADRKSYERHVSKLVILELDQEENPKNQD